MNIGKKKIKKIIILLLLICNFCFAEDIENIELLSVYDGDTFKVNIKDAKYELFGKNIGVRVYGLDTPEIKGKTEREKQLAKQAKSLTAAILKSGKIVLRNVKRDKYFRILAQVYVIDETDSIEINLAQVLISNKLARPYFGGKKESW